MPIEFKCPTCNVSIRVPEVHAGKKGHCPSCRGALRIPAAGASNSSAIDKVKSGAALKSPAPAFITFTCPSCEKRTGFPANLAGRAAPCPVCQANIMVPAEADGASFVVGHRQAPAVQTPAEPPLKKSPVVWAIGGVGAAGLIFAIAFLAGKMGQSSPPPQANTTQAGPASTRVAVADPPKPAREIPAAAPLAPVTPAVPAAVPVAPLLPAPAAVAPAANVPKEEEPVARSSRRSDDRDLSPAEKAFGSGTQSEIKPAVPAPAKPAAPAATEDAGAALNARESKSAAPDDAAETEAPVAKRKSNDRDDVSDEAPEVKERKEALAEKKGAAAKPADAPASRVAKPAAPAPVCPQCLGTGYLPLIGLRPYIRGGSEPINASTAAAAVPFRFCTRCGVGKDPKSLVQAETARLAEAAEIHKNWEKMAGTKLSYVETHHVTLRSTMPESELKIVASALEQLTGLLQNSTLSTVLAQTRPETDQILIGADKGGYLLFLDALKAQDPQNDWSLAKDSTGFMMPHMAVFNAQRGGGKGSCSMALYQFGEMLMMRATDNKAPAWLRLGFASYCENVITRKNLVYAFQYEKNEVHFGDNWDAEIKKYAAQSKLKTWDLVFRMSPDGASAIDYLTSYSMVNFFMTSDPKLFAKLVVAIREGLDSEHAVQKVYSSDYKRIQMMWANWAITK